MKRNKITAVILSFVMSMSLMMPSAAVLADEASDPSETQKTETVETKETKATEKQTPKETEKQESKVTETQETKKAEKSEPDTTETQESKESKTQESKETETKETKATETQVPKETDKQEPAESDETQITETAGSDEKEPAESKDNGDNPEESNETAVVEGNIPSQSASSPKKNAVTGTGTCGDNLTWSIDDYNHTLTISGSGKMMNFKKSSAPWDYYRDRIENVVLSENLVHIGDNAFYECFSLTSITIPDSVTSIGNSAFSGCRSLTSVTIPDSVKEIGDYAFSGCNITSITIPDSVDEIGDYAFSHCYELKSVTTPDSVYKIGDYAFSECDGLESIKLPKSVKKYGTGVLKGCRNLTSLELPKGVTSIGENEFHNYSYLKSVTIPESVEIIGKDAFSDCYALTSVTIHDSVRIIDNCAFRNCTALTSVTIPKNVDGIGTDAFGGCSKLTDVYYGNSEEKWKTIQIYSGNEYLLKATIHYGAAYSITVNSGKTNIAKAAEGTKVIVTANAAPSGKVFDKWIVDSGNVSLSNDSSSTTTFTMPAEDVEVTATYKVAEYTIKVNNGSATPATATAGTVITLTADAAPYGKAFDKWIVNSGTVSLSNASSSTTTFIMPAKNVEVTATYIDVEYAIKVNNGVASPATNNTTASRITALAETKIILTADDAPSGKVFDKWIVVSGSVKLANSGLSSVTWFTMPAENVEVTATYKTVPSGNYIVKINNGVATPLTSAPGLVVNVKANDAPAGTEFEKWEVVSGTVIFADSSSATTFFVMPAENVEITAKYKSKLSVKGKTATVKYSKVKKKNQTLAVSKVLTFVDKGQGQLTYAKVSGNSKILINKTTGAITVKKKLKKKTYTVKVKVQASGNDSCNPSGWKTVTFKIKVK